MTGKLLSFSFGAVACAAVLIGRGPQARADEIFNWNCGDTDSCLDAATFNEAATLDFSGSGPLDLDPATLTIDFSGSQYEVNVPAGLVSSSYVAGSSPLVFGDEFIASTSNPNFEVSFDPPENADFILFGADADESDAFGSDNGFFNLDSSNGNGGNGGNGGMPVPEVPSLAIFGTALAGFGGYRLTQRFGGARLG
jgi:hypothetical protein